jgi:hypothetical protein
MQLSIEHENYFSACWQVEQPKFVASQTSQDKRR